MWAASSISLPSKCATYQPISVTLTNMRKMKDKDKGSAPSESVKNLEGIESKNEMADHKQTKAAIPIKQTQNIANNHLESLQRRIIWAIASKKRKGIRVKGNNLCLS